MGCGGSFPPASSGRNGAQLLELGKDEKRLREWFRGWDAAMEPSFWSWEKRNGPARGCVPPWPQWSPAFGAGKSRTKLWLMYRLYRPQWSPAFGAGKRRHPRRSKARHVRRNGAQLLELGKASMRLARTARRLGAAMEPSFWSWEKSAPHRQCAYGSHAAMEPSFWSWEKHIGPPAPHKKTPSPQWSPAFGAGKSGSGSAHAVMSSAPQWSPAFGAGKRARDFFTN